MAVEAQADSGLLPEGDAGSVKEVSGLDKALNAALGGLDEDGDVPLHLADEAKKAALTGKKKSDAGDKSDDSEDARVEGNKAEATKTSEAAPTEGNAAPFVAPKHWPDDIRKAFAGWPKQVQDEFLKRDKDLQGSVTRKSMELSDQVKFAEGIRSAIDDTVRQQFAQHGMDEVAGVRYLTQLQKFATQRPAEYVVWAMQNLGVRPEHLGLSVASQQPRPQTQQTSVKTGDARLDELLSLENDPAVVQLRQQLGQTHDTVQQLQARLQQQDRERAQWEQQQKQQVVSNLTKTWNDFRSALDDHGQLKYPNADALKVQIGAIMETDPEIAQMQDSEAKLAAAYDAAEWARGNFRSGRLEQERAKAAAAAAKTAEAERAKKVTAVKPASGAPAVPKKSKGLDSALDAAWATVRGGE